MAVLGATTLTGCNSIPDFIPTGTVTAFVQAAAPTSWTRVETDTANNRMLRIVSSGNGGVLGGSASPILNNVVPSHTHGFTTGGHSVDHSHSGNTGNVSSDHTHTFPVYSAQPAANIGTFVGNHRFSVALNQVTTGISANHFHGFSTGGVSVNHTHSGTTDNGSSQTNWSPRYVDTLLCSKN
jgi:hypothetical protein